MAEGRSFNIVANEVCVEYEEKKSKFYGYSKYVKNEEQVNEYLNLLWQAHPQATHICYAFILGQRGEITKNNDNGEPAGTAGMPIQEAIKKRGLTNTLVAVVRYFGGKELGANGLYKAYFKTTLDTLDEANYYVMEECAVYEFKFTYNEFAKIGAYLRDYNYPALRIQYLDIVKAEIAFPVSKEQLIFSELKMLLNGRVINNKLRTAFFRFDPPSQKKGK